MRDQDDEVIQASCSSTNSLYLFFDDKHGGVTAIYKSLKFGLNKIFDIYEICQN